MIFRIPPIALLAAGLLLSEVLPADCQGDVPPVAPEQVVGTVYGKKITAGDIKLTGPIDISKKFDASDTAEWEQMKRIMKAFGEPITTRFERDHKLAASEEEVRKFKEDYKAFSQRMSQRDKTRLDEIEKKLAADKLSEAERADLTEQREKLNQILRSEPAAPDVPDAFAKQFILAWKTERALHKQYGGRVVFQQLGPEALDARRQLFEEAEKRGDLKFADAGVRHLFYYYYVNVEHIVTDDEMLEPWWERPR